MNLSIIRVQGLSMFPFFKTDDLLVVKSIDIHDNIAIGSCIIQNNLAHRLVTPLNTKGDRLVYLDPFLFESSQAKLVIGRILNKKQKNKISLHQHYVLRKISAAIAFFSIGNQEKYKTRIVSLIIVFFLASVHRRLEPIIASKYKDRR